MTDEQLINWCDDHDLPIKVAAVLSVWNPDYDELEEWTIGKTEVEDEFVINGDTYKILDDVEAENFLDEKQECYQELMLQEIPDYIQPFIDWYKYWETYPLCIEEEIYGAEEVLFDKDYYYYACL